jgi:hypothetical protein
VWNNDPILGDMDAYDDAQYHNLFRRDINSIGVSPNVDLFINALHLGRVNLTDD